MKATEYLQSIIASIALLQDYPAEKLAQAEAELREIDNKLDSVVNELEGF